MGELGALFNPGMRHELEERRSKAMRREEEGNARDGDPRIDLEAGVVVINSPGASRTVSSQSAASDADGDVGTEDNNDIDVDQSADHGELEPATDDGQAPAVSDAPKANVAARNGQAPSPSSSGTSSRATGERIKPKSDGDKSAGPGRTARARPMTKNRRAAG